MKTQQIYELILGENFTLIIYFQPDDWNSIQICKRIYGVVSDEVLTDSYSAILKYAIDCAVSYPGRFINSSFSWPIEADVRSRSYDKIKSFLQEYSKYFETVKRKGVRWMGNVDFIAVGEPTVTQINTTTILELGTQSSEEKMRSEFFYGMGKDEYRDWEIRTLNQIYSDWDMINLFGTSYPEVIIEGSREIRYPFIELNKPENLLPRNESFHYESSYLFYDYQKIVNNNIRCPDLYGFANEQLILDSNNMIIGFKARPRKYNETAYTSNILLYELWRSFQLHPNDHLAKLDDLPLRKEIHSLNKNAVLSGFGRSSLFGICMVVLAYDDVEDDYNIAVAVRSSNVDSYQGYLSLVPSGGFELFEHETMQNDYTIRKNFNILSALYREFIEELFGDVSFEKPTGDDDLRRLNRNEHVKAIKNGIGTSYYFEFLGVTISLVNLRPSLAFVLKIDDPSFLNERIKKNEENIDLRFIAPSRFEDILLLNDNNLHLMPESAGLYALFMKSHIYRDIQNYHKKQ